MMEVEQEGLCKICHEPPNLHDKLYVDHCHKTGKVRGLLCQSCNSGLGFLKDDIDIIATALEYLRCYG